MASKMMCGSKPKTCGNISLDESRTPMRTNAASTLARAGQVPRRAAARPWSRGQAQDEQERYERADVHVVPGRGLGSQVHPRKNRVQERAPRSHVTGPHSWCALEQSAMVTEVPANLASFKK